MELKRDPWQSLTRWTTARIALGRAGGSVRTDTLLDLRLAHARARDAVHVPFDSSALRQRLSSVGVASQCLSTLVRDRLHYLKRPDAGRGLAPASRDELQRLLPAMGARDLVIVISDGLSALAAERQAVPTVTRLLPLLAVHSITCFPVFVVPYARVKIADEIGAILDAPLSLILLGERPGLSSADSLGAYVTYRPHRECMDADRNCVSNIRAEGLPPPAAARTIASLLVVALRRGLSGVGLKVDETVLDESEPGGILTR